MWFEEEDHPLLVRVVVHRAEEEERRRLDLHLGHGLEEVEVDRVGHHLRPRPRRRLQQQLLVPAAGQHHAVEPAPGRHLVGAELGPVARGIGLAQQRRLLLGGAADDVVFDVVLVEHKPGAARAMERVARHRCELDADHVEGAGYEQPVERALKRRHPIAQPFEAARREHRAQLLQALAPPALRPRRVEDGDDLPAIAPGRREPVFVFLAHLRERGDGVAARGEAGHQRVDAPSAAEGWWARQVGGDEQDFRSGRDCSRSRAGGETELGDGRAGPRAALSGSRWW